MRFYTSYIPNSIAKFIIFRLKLLKRRYPIKLLISYVNLPDRLGDALFLET